MKNFADNVQAANQYLRRIDSADGSRCARRQQAVRIAGRENPERPEGVSAGDQPRAGARPADGEAKNRQPLTLSTLERKPTPCPRPCNHPPAAPGRKPRPPPQPARAGRNDLHSAADRNDHPDAAGRGARPGAACRARPEPTPSTDRNYLPKTLAKFFAIGAIEIESPTFGYENSLRRGPAKSQPHDGWRSSKKNGIQLTRYGRRSRPIPACHAMGLPAPPTTARSVPVTEAGQAAADYRSAVAAEASRATSEIWTCLHLRCWRLPASRPTRAISCYRWRRNSTGFPRLTPTRRLVAKILGLQSVAAKHGEWSQAADTARKAHSDTVKRHKSELEVAWKKMRVTENRCQQAGDAARKLDELRFRNPWFFTPDGRPRLRTAVN